MEYINTFDEQTLNEFKTNLLNLIHEAKQKGEITRFVLIREDDFLPSNWEWKSNSMYTQMEYAPFYLSYPLYKTKEYELLKQMREKKRESKEKPKKGFFSKLFPQTKKRISIDIPASDEEESILKKMPIDDLDNRVLIPTGFRLTKHFTINAPLANTADYNNGISAERNFIIIDDAEPFFQNPYVFSASYNDSYLDASHEPFPVSKQAIILISKNKYQKVLENSQNAELLKQRKVILFEGDEAMAVNIVLTSLGILPRKFDQDYYRIDKELENLMENSLEKKCKENNIPFKIAHDHHFTTDVSEKYPNEIIHENNA